MATQFEFYYYDLKIKSLVNFFLKQLPRTMKDSEKILDFLEAVYHKFRKVSVYKNYF